MRPRGLRELHRDRSGNVVVIFMLGVLSLVLLLVMMMNTGQQLVRRTEVQNAADAAALTQAHWAARSMNVVSMNQVAMAQTMSVSVAAEALQAFLITAAPTFAKVEKELIDIAKGVCAVDPTKIACAAAWLEVARYSLHVIGAAIDIEIRLLTSDVIFNMGRHAHAMSDMNDHVVAEFPEFMAELEHEIAQENRVADPLFFPAAQRGSHTTELPVELVPIVGFPDLCSVPWFGNVLNANENFANQGYGQLVGPYQVARDDVSRRLTDGTWFDPTKAGPLHHGRLLVAGLLPSNRYGAPTTQEVDDNAYKDLDLVFFGGHCASRTTLDDLFTPLHVYQVKGRPIVQITPSRGLRDQLSLVAFTRRVAGAAVRTDRWYVASEDTYGYAQAEVYNTSRIGLLGSELPAQYDLFSQGWRGRLVPATLLASHRDRVADVLDDYGYLQSTLRDLPLEVLRPDHPRSINAH
jgi:hypothetical protein